MSQSNPNLSSPQVTPERIMQFAWGYAAPLLIETAIHHRVFDILDDGPHTVQQVSKETGASVRGLRAVMNALVALQFLSKDEKGRYELTAESAAFLVSTKPGFQGGIFKHISQQLLPKWLHINDVVGTGRPSIAVNAQDEGAGFFERFVEDIFPMSYPAATALGHALRLNQSSGEVRVLDLAAGSGVWGIALAQQSPKVSVTAVDWAGVIPVTRRIAEKFKLSNRFRFVEGDIQQVDLGHGHHVATLGHILHSEGESHSRSLLKRTFDALAPGGTIAIAEFVANDNRTGPPNAMIFAVNMLMNTEEGDAFTFSEIRSWLSDSGFKDIRTLDAPGPSPLILANKP